MEIYLNYERTTNNIMKTIYMEPTINMIGQKAINDNTPNVVPDLVKQGIVKELKSGLKYLVIEDKINEK
jgi:hypothetical protein|tara:strand:- start:16 stop:222 length:207 start_codon:yes stop_codon:yes gene_type:complete